MIIYFIFQPPVLEYIVNHDSQLTAANREKLSVPITDGLLNITGLLKELPLPIPLPGLSVDRCLLSNIPGSEDTRWLLKIRDSVIIPKLMDCLCNTNMEKLEMIKDKNYRDISHSGQIPILLKTLLERNPVIFNNSSHGLDQDSISQFTMENEKSDSAPNNSRKLSDNRHQSLAKQ